MAATAAARRALSQFSSSASARALLRTRPSTTASPFAFNASRLSGLSSPAQATAASSASRSSLRSLTLSRLPVELGAVLSLMPLHTATASSLFTSLLSLHSQSWGCLSEGFATPL